MVSPQKEGYDALVEAITAFGLSAASLSGQTYDSARGYFLSVLLPLAKGGKLLSEKVAEAAKKLPDGYKTDVDSCDLKESELEEKNAQLKDVIEQKKAENQALRMLMIGLTSEEAAPLRAAQRSNIRMMQTTSELLKKVQEKLEKLLAYNAKSAQLFSDIETLNTHINTGLCNASKAWNGKGFSKLSDEDMEWVTGIDQVWLDGEIDYILSNIPNLTLDMFDDLIKYAESHPNKEVPSKLINYLKDNKNSILTDMKNDAAVSLIELLGQQTIKLAGILNVLNGIKGPVGAEQFVMIKPSALGNPYGVGNHTISTGLQISQVGQYVGHGVSIAGFGLGMYDDMVNDDKTAGQAIAHNTSSFVVSSGASYFASAVATTLAVSNPMGWAVVAGFAAGTMVGIGFGYLYNNNIGGLQDKLDAVGEAIDGAFSWLITQPPVFV